MLGIIFAMKYVHNVTVTVFVKQEQLIENPQINDIIKSKIKEMLPIDWEKNKPDYKQTKAEGLSANTITIHELKIHKEKETNIFIKEVLSHLIKEQKELLLKEKELRLDENDDFYIRLDKEKLLQKEYSITTSGDCFHIKMNIASFPKKRENALKVIDEMLSL